MIRIFWIFVDSVERDPHTTLTTGCWFVVSGSIALVFSLLWIAAITTALTTTPTFP